MRTNLSLLSVVSFGATVLSVPIASAQHTGDIWIGRSSEAAGHRLKVAFAVGGFNPYEPLENRVVLSPITGFFEGWSGEAPGFDAIETESPADDTYELSQGADVWLDIVAIDPAFVVIVAPSYEILDSAGQSAHLGDYQLHKHLIWLIDSTSPSFDPTQCTWRVTFRLRDAGRTAYAPSVPFTIRFATGDVNPADFECDGDVDLTDFGHFQACFNGPNRPSAAGCSADADFDNDVDVDLSDFSVFQSCFNGPNRPPAC